MRSDPPTRCRASRPADRCHSCRYLLGEISGEPTSPGHLGAWPRAHSASCATLSPMGTMPAIVYVGDGAIEVQRVDVPDLGPDQVRIAVSHCGICGTDLHLVLEQMASPGSGLGHEWAGTIEAVGDDVTAWAPGDRVVAGPGPGCGECRACRKGRPSVCLNRAAAAGLRPGTGARSRSTRRSRRSGCSASRIRCRRVPRHSPSRRRSRSTP